MDPLSVTASIIAVLQLARGVGQGFQRLLAVRGATDQLLQVMNEVTDFEALVHDIHNFIEDRKNVISFDSATFRTLPAQCDRSKKQMEDLNTLIQHCIKDKSVSKMDLHQKVKKVAWLRTIEKMTVMQASIRESRVQMSTTLASLMSIDLLHVRLILRDFSVIQTTNGDDLTKLTRMIKRFNSLDKVPEQLREVLTLLKPTPPGSLSSQLAPTTTNGFTGAENLITNHVSSAANPGTHLVPDGQTLRLKFSTYSTNKMTRPCPCDCHKPATLKSSELMQKVVGQLFMGYSGQVSRFRECKKCPCVKVNDARVNFTYYFPAWFLTRALEMVFKNSRLNGPSLGLRTYRVIPDESLLFHFARAGMITEIQNLFFDNLASPLDISAKTGRSALHFAADYGQDDTCNFLIKYGADAYFEDKLFMSPFDIVWEKQIEKRPKTAALAFGLVDQTYDLDLLMKRGLLPLHRAVLGISQASVVAQLESSWSEVNMADFWGRVPLAWAAGRGDFSTVKALLEWQADATIPDKGGWTPLHHAARAEDPICIKVLLEANAPINARNNRGNTPLVVACSYRDSPEHILPFLLSGADVSMPMKDGYTPLAISVKLNHTKCARLLVEHGASVDGIDNHMAYPIHVATSYNSHEALIWLLTLKQDHSVLDCNHWSLLHYAACSGDVVTLRILEENHLSALNPEGKSIEDKTALDIFHKLRAKSLNEEPEIYQKSLQAFESLLASLALYHDSMASSPLSSLDEWHDALDKMEMGDSGILTKETIGYE